MDICQDNSEFRYDIGEFCRDIGVNINFCRDIHFWRDILVVMNPGDIETRSVDICQDNSEFLYDIG